MFINTLILYKLENLKIQFNLNFTYLIIEFYEMFRHCTKKLLIITKLLKITL
jgi:hypothetical protein